MVLWSDEEKKPREGFRVRYVVVYVSVSATSGLLMLLWTTVLLLLACCSCSGLCCSVGCWVASALMVVACCSSTPLLLLPFSLFFRLHSFYSSSSSFSLPFSMSLFFFFSS
eukprot:TRINITY_DN29561_c2_g1_i1.p1 TRINITY_DN29561_c2_g1~~TRINITY_DN29561_c2_g1_i1.p1  ORF type:complete len:111 (+),score=17.45 TRINITY_DN29561_c2_g1_i1:229-561(+)